MALEVLTGPIHYGSPDRVRYKLEIGDVLANDFFLPIERERLLKEKAILEVNRSPNVFPKGENIKPLTDIGRMKITEAKEFLEEEYDVTKLEKYYDQESGRKSPRKKLLQWIERKSNELTGFEPARVK